MNGKYYCVMLEGAWYDSERRILCLFDEGNSVFSLDKDELEDLIVKERFQVLPDMYIIPSNIPEAIKKKLMDSKKKYDIMRTRRMDGY